MQCSPIENIIQTIKDGGVVIVVDAEDRENEGDFICAAEKITPEIVKIVHRNAVQSVDPSEPEWRLLRSPEALTYVILSLIHTESGGDPQAVGDDGRARGLTQIWHSTAHSYGPVTPDALLDPATNIEFAFKHFRYLLKKYKGNFPLALYGWNRGTGTVDRLIRYGNSPANGYGRKVYRAALNIKKRHGLDAIGN